MPESAPWLAQYLQEMTVFPNGKHDDQVDSTAQMLDWFKRGAGPTSTPGSSSFTGSAQRSSAGGRRRALRSVSAPRAASRMSSCFPASHRAVAPDGTVEMTEADAAPLLQAGWVRVDAGDLAESQAAVF
jgi:hypothetical protein